MNTEDSPLAHFGRMIDHCYDYAEASKAEGRPIVGIMCEYTPREVILAAGAVPVCLCGGSLETIPAAESCLPANLCPLIKSTFGYHLRRDNPFLEWSDLVVAETTCDGKKKMFEMMSETRPMHILELPQKADEPDALARWTHEVRKFKSALEERFRVRIADDELRAAVRLMNRERDLRRRLAGLMAHDRPPLTGRQLLEFKSIISGIAADFEQYEKAIRMFEEGAAAPGSPRDRKTVPPPVRVLMTGVPMVHGAERVIELVENCGAVVVAQENCTGLKPLLENIDADAPDPLQAIAAKYYHLPCSVMTVNARRLETLRDLSARFRPEAVIELVWHACLTYDIESQRVRRCVEGRAFDSPLARGLYQRASTADKDPQAKPGAPAAVENEIHLPYLKIETDYSPSDSARLAVRVEALIETVRERASKGPRKLKEQP